MQMSYKIEIVLNALNYLDRISELFFFVLKVSYEY